MKLMSTFHQYRFFCCFSSILHVCPLQQVAVNEVTTYSHLDLLFWYVLMKSMRVWMWKSMAGPAQQNTEIYGISVRLVLMMPYFWNVSSHLMSWSGDNLQRWSTKEHVPWRREAIAEVRWERNWHFQCGSQWRLPRWHGEVPDLWSTTAICMTVDD